MHSENHRLLFTKRGRAVYISHLDLMRTFQRAFVRAGIQIRHTEGFNPHPYLNFALPMSLGDESLCELLDFTLEGGMECRDVPNLLNPALPEGIQVLECYDVRRPFAEIKWLSVETEYEFDRGTPDDA